MRTNKFIILRSRKELIRINTENILVVVGDAYCTGIYLDEPDNCFTSTKNLKEIEKLIPPLTT